MKTLILTLIFASSLSHASITVPQLSGPVVDQTGVISSPASLEAKIRQIYNQGSGPQINILVVPTLGGYSVEEYAHKVFTTWKLGDKQRDDGVLFLVAINDRKMRIEVGQGLEGSLTDLSSNRILTSLRPYFKEQRYEAGITYGLDQIISIVSKRGAVQVTTTPTQDTLSEPTYNSDLLNIFYALLATVLFYFLFLSTISGKIKKEINQKDRDLIDSKEEVQDLQYKINSYNEKTKEVEAKNKSTLREISNKLSAKIKSEEETLKTLTIKLSSLEDQKESCDQTKLDSLQEQKSSEKSQIKKIEYNIISYNQIVKEGN